MKIRIFSISILAIVAMALMSCSDESPTPTPASLGTVEVSANPTETPEPEIVIADDGGIQFVLNMAQNGSPQTGTATFTQIGTTIDLRVRLSPSVPVQMMVLRRGTCENITGYVRDLDPVIGGVSTQEIRDMGISAVTQGDMVLVVGRGATSFNDVAACADLPVIDS